MNRSKALELIDKMRNEAEAQRREDGFPDQGVFYGSADLLEEAADLLAKEVSPSEGDIKSRADAIRRRLKAHDGQRKIIEAELLALQHTCGHENATTRTYGDYGGGTSTEWRCPDCGLAKYT